MGHKARKNALVEVAEELCEAVDGLRFEPPVAYVYNPLRYAWDLHRAYIEAFGDSEKDVVFLGMNPGPWGMAQNGVPFGEVAAVRDWMGLRGEVGKPEREHPKRPIEGLACTRSEVSGARLWGWARERYGSPQAFFSTRFVLNYCPLVFMEEGGKNRTPDKLPAAEREPLELACDRALRRSIEILRPKTVVGVGAYAEAQARRVLTEDASLSFGRILHPSPASPIANRGWAPQAEKQLREMDLL